MRILFVIFVLLISFSVAMAKVNLNTATVEELVAVKGIGKKTAESIVEYRTANGPFASVNDLVNIKGIGPGSLKRFSEELEVTPTAPVEPVVPVAPTVAQ